MFDVCRVLQVRRMEESLWKCPKKVARVRYPFKSGMVSLGRRVQQLLPWKVPSRRIVESQQQLCWEKHKETDCYKRPSWRLREQLAKPLEIVSERSPMNLKREPFMKYDRYVI
jgi:hypothetical protein